MTIAQILQKCSTLPDLPIVVECKDSFIYDGSSPYDLDSYRGRYDELAIGVTKNSSMLLYDFSAKMRESTDKSYYGYKGEEPYHMYNDTFVWLAMHGDHLTGLMVTDIYLSSNKETIRLVAIKNDL